MNRLEAIAEVEKWRDSANVVTEEEFEQLYEVYYEKLESIDNQCEGYTDFEDVPNLHFCTHQQCIHHYEEACYRFPQVQQ